MLLALLKDNYINRENNCFSMINDLNSRAEEILYEKEKREFVNCIKINLPPTPENHIKFRKALLETLQELDSINIRSAMNSGTDILGRFYEQFLKYGNGSKEIGIVLTPRHITKFSVDVLNVTNKDKVFDPACGTGGFLVSAFDKVKSEVDEKELDRFKINGIYGIEQDSEVVALALVNMIFRGDGRTNLEEGNCFTTKKFNDLKVSKVLMNPPFALKKGDERESKFIDFALEKLEKNGYLFAIVPISVMCEQSGIFWRKDLLEKNTILSVITLPEELFYPVSVGTVAIFIKKGIPHNFNEQKVYFARTIKDGFRKKKGKRVQDNKEINQLNEIHDELKAFLVNQNLKFENVPEFKKICLLNKDDGNYELIPEFYLDNKTPKQEEIENEIDQMVRSSFCYLVQNKKIYKSTQNNIINYSKKINPKKFASLPVIFNNNSLHGLCVIEKKTALPQNILDKGETPYVTTSSLNNGVSGFYDIEPNSLSKCITVALNGSVGETFFQFEDFVTSSDNVVLRLKSFYNPYLLFYIAVMIKRHQWRYNYYRKLTMQKLTKMEIQVPIVDDDIDYLYIEQIVKNSYGYGEIEKFII